jgi:hypothetical protein
MQWDFHPVLYYQIIKLARFCAKVFREKQQVLAQGQAADDIWLFLGKEKHQNLFRFRCFWWSIGDSNSK